MFQLSTIILAGCFLYRAWEALLIGAVGALLVIFTTPYFDMIGVDDPVGASAVHGIGGIWGVVAVGLFADLPLPLETTSGRRGLFKGGGWELLGIQSLAALCLTSWGVLSTILLLWCIDRFVSIRAEPHEELLGADLMEHKIRHGNVCKKFLISIHLMSILISRLEFHEHYQHSLQ